MNMLMCCVYDRATGAYMQPFYVRSKGEAIRSFTDACVDGKTNFCKHPEDFSLFIVGAFDDSNGMVTACELLPLITALECVHVVEESNAKGIPF